MEKKSLRKIIINRRDTMKKEIRREKEIVIKEELRNTLLYKKSKNIFIYIGYGSEINTSLIIEDMLDDNKCVLVPRIDSINREMQAIQINSLEGLELNRYGILEPSHSKKAFNRNEIDLIILPGVAFDDKGGRLGYGGGYYDKYLTNLNTFIPKVVLAYDFQILENIPLEEHDIKYDYLITEKRSINLLHYT